MYVEVYLYKKRWRWVRLERIALPMSLPKFFYIDAVCILLFLN
jgi:hypothetical protein